MAASADLIPPVYVEDARLADLRAAELLVAVSTRLYVLPRAAANLRADWRGGFQAAGLGAAGISAFEAFFTIVGHGQSRPLDIRCPCQRVLGSDEARLLQMLSLFQHDRRPAAEAILGDWLVPTARRLATSQAEALAMAMKRARLIVPWRHAEVAGLGSPSRGDIGLALLH